MTTIYFEKPYNPNKEYYFLDYHCSYETRWVRCPYKTWEEVTKIIQELNLQWGFDKEAKGRVNFPTNVRITPERELAEWDWKFKHGIADKYDWLMHNDPDKFPDRESAQDYLFDRQEKEEEVQQEVSPLLEALTKPV